MIDIQVQMCERAIELLLLPEDQSCLLLDIGCGSGLSGSVLEDQGHLWIGVDISPSMLGKYFSLLCDIIILYKLFSH